MAESENGKIQAVLSNLGRATLRGIRKCPKCGFVNGTRGYVCKNNSCHALLKETTVNKWKKCEAVRIDTGTYTHIYSICLSKADKSMEVRGFVQLPTSERLHCFSVGNDTFSLRLDSNDLNSSALCFVSSCHRQFDMSILTCHEQTSKYSMSSIASLKQNNETPFCCHIQWAYKCSKTSKPCTLNSRSLSNILASSLFTIPVEIKDELILLAAEVNENSGPMVQRVSQNTMVVKCKPSSRHPLGYLHITFNMIKTSWANVETECEYNCDCTNESVSLTYVNIQLVWKCVHYYACLCAFSNEESLSQEFNHIIDLEKPQILRNCVVTNTEGIKSDVIDSAQFFDVVFTDDIPVLPDIDIKFNDDQIIIEDVPNPSSFDQDLISSAELLLVDDLQSTFETDFCANQIISDVNIETNIINNTKTTLNKPTRVASKPKKIVNKSNMRRKTKRVLKIEKPVIEKAIIVNEVSLAFSNWLAMITESINQSICAYIYNLADANDAQKRADPCNKIDELTFMAPQNFFDCLRDRISNDRNKKPLPLYISQVQRARPFGVFTRYTWHILNVLHLKRVFETSLVPLEICKTYFVDDSKGLMETSQLDQESNTNCKRICPRGFRAFLKVGYMSADQEKPYPFIIEWIPDLYPITKTGEITFKFQHGHMQKLN